MSYTGSKLAAATRIANWLISHSKEEEEELLIESFSINLGHEFCRTHTHTHEHNSSIKGPCSMRQAQGIESLLDFFFFLILICSSLSANQFLLSLSLSFQQEEEGGKKLFVPFLSPHFIMADGVHLEKEKWRWRRHAINLYRQKCSSPLSPHTHTQEQGFLPGLEVDGSEAKHDQRKQRNDKMAKAYVFSMNAALFVWRVVHGI